MSISIHSLKERRCKCHVCGKTFAEIKMRVFHRLRTDKEIVVIVLTLLAHGCPIQAIEAAFGLDERTIISRPERAGKHCEQVHQHLVEQSRDLGQVQADEIGVKKQNGIIWMAIALNPYPSLARRCPQRASRCALDYGANPKGLRLCLVLPGAVLH